MRMGALAPLAKPDHTPFRGPKLDQLQANSCTAFDMARRIQLFCAMNGMGANVHAAELDIYFRSRAEEYAGLDPDSRPPLLDQGTQPLNVLRVVEAGGFALASDYPYSDDPQRIAAEPPPSLYLKSYGQRGMRWGEIDEVATARSARAAEAMVHRTSVGFGMTIDGAFAANSGQRVTTIDPTNIVGGHMMTVLAILDAELIELLGPKFNLPSDVQPGDVLCDQWWGLLWGLKGCGLVVLSRGVFGSVWVSDVSMVEGVPPVLNRSEP